MAKQAAARAQAIATHTFAGSDRLNKVRQQGCFVTLFYLHTLFTFQNGKYLTAQPSSSRPGGGQAGGTRGLLR